MSNILNMFWTWTIFVRVIAQNVIQYLEYSLIIVDN